MSIVIRPIITEKASAASERFNRYSFEVAPRANKIEIKNAIEIRLWCVCGQSSYSYRTS